MAQKDIDRIQYTAAVMQSEGRHEEAIDLLEAELKAGHPSGPQDKSIKHQLAQVYGGLVESRLKRQDQMGITPGADQLAEMERLLARAMELDPALADLQWDKAVISARFRRRYNEADEYLARAQALGYNHPMMARLKALIEQGQAGDAAPLPTSKTEPNPMLRQLNELVQQAQGPYAATLDSELDAEAGGLPGKRTLKEYCQQAIQGIEQGKINADQYMVALRAANCLGGVVGEYALDFLRRVAPALKDSQIERFATESHLRILVQVAQAFRSRVDQDGVAALRRTRKVAKRGLHIIDQCGFEVDPDLHAEVLLAYGGAFAHHQDANLREAFRSYLEALELKREAGNQEDVQRLKALLAQMCEYQMQQTLMSGVMGIGGVGEQLEALKLAYQAALQTERHELALECGIQLAEALGNVNQPAEAIPILEALCADASLNRQQRFSVEFTLAARLSETRKPDAIKRARSIGERQVQQFKQGARYEVAGQTLWMNLGNFRRLDGDLPEARNAFRKALELCPAPSGEELPLALGQIRMLLAETEILLGNTSAGRELLEQADEVYRLVFGVGRLHFESIAARLLLQMGDAKAAATHADQGIATRKFILEQGPAPEVWESMLQEWTRLDVCAVRARHQLGGAAAMREALLLAEAAKGRLFNWFARARWGQKAPELALDAGRHEQALKVVQGWAAAGRRWVVSLFAHKEGISIMSVGPDGDIRGKWIDSFDYDDLRLRVFDPLEQGLSDALEGGDLTVRGLSAAVVDMLLARIGGWLWEAQRELAQGGEELVILPHRLFRSLPLSHARMPGGKCLSELFEQVSLCPSLQELSNAIQVHASAHEPHWRCDLPQLGLLDSDTQRGLPFAHLEGLAALGQEQVIQGPEVTVARIDQALAAPGILLLSCHGDFNEHNPWQSTIQGADGKLVLADMLAEGHAVSTQLVVLGVCEAGKSRRSLSDEPVSFPGFLVTLGAGLVIAPMWQVDDFASFLFISRLFRELHAGHHPAKAAAVAAHWQRTLSARDALAELDGIAARVNAGEWSLPAETRGTLQQRISRYRLWLTEDLEPDDYAFDALDWSAFQVHGYLGQGQVDQAENTLQE